MSGQTVQPLRIARAAGETAGAATTAARERVPLLRRPGVARALAPWCVGFLMLGIWQAWCTLGAVPAYLVPSPAAIVQQLVQDWPMLFASLLATLKITLLAFAVATVLGVAIALLFVQSPLIEASLFPYAILLQVTPVVAIAPLIIIWVKNTTAALVVCAMLVALFPVISNTALGLRSVNPGLVNLFRIHRATRWQTLVRLRIPSALPYFFGGLRISSGLSLIGAVVAEFVAGTGGSGAGLAYQILQAGFQLNIPRLFAALLLITVTGVLLFGMTVWLSRVCLRGWHESEL
ncbi:NitT/TauT family transport system permease protein [Paraburkholderia tropica]|uniref:NitT/TauT family transport system permease protein n=2 Tax=Burkholderiaceae TaxID=119060 RepID=A0AAQ1GMQ1_9BURK|nr:NitT/TauT family transport system permease protein [Paraburkholderia tropica]MBB3001514.1 NitT/TauT family transport system permease protein [Paraburkholderia tropica]MBB6322831.1 NitT/TauT family transport system permease protein [Paraburkholderia tropica]PXX08954.1 NitT/TauT family transport system permease protein [Paraburkholderia tropica]PZW74275.1 NitT/TauT family transport system permease protein [Paraburkholderia tropica]